MFFVGWRACFIGRDAMDDRAGQGHTVGQLPLPEARLCANMPATRNEDAMARLLKFQTLVWSAIACAVFWLLAWPLIQNAWAAGYWKQVPCALGEEGRYVYQMEG